MSFVELKAGITLEKVLYDSTSTPVTLLECQQQLFLTYFGDFWHVTSKTEYHLLVSLTPFMGDHLSVI